MALAYSEMEAVLMKELRLYHHPVAITFLFTDEDVARFREATPHVVPVRPLTFCQWEIAARMEARTVLGEKKHLGCRNGNISFGWAEPDEDDIKDAAAGFGSREVAELILHSKPRLSPGSVKAVAAGPLGKAAIPPHVVHFYCDNMQSHALAAEYMAATKTHPLRPMVCESSSACGGGVFCHQEQTFNMTPCCQGSYNSGKTERGEVNVFIPGAHMEATVERLHNRVRQTSGYTYPGADICKNCPMIDFERGSRKTRKSG